MASEDVIELGSSDEESEPAHKKANTSKRRPNAMVQIPPGLTIKPSMSGNGNINPIKKLLNKGLTVTKVKTTNQLSSNSRNRKPPAKPVRPLMQNIKLTNPGLMPVQRPALPVQSAFVIPVNIMKKLNNSVMNVKTSNPQRYNFPQKIQNVKSLHNLSSLTIKKAPGAGVDFVGPGSSGVRPAASKRPAVTSIPIIRKKQKVTPKQQMLTVNLDDEDVPTTSTASPQWYLRPEDALAPMVNEEDNSHKQSMEMQNNAEPKTYVEITIEDSPVKPIHNKRTHEVGAELAITIDDSPVKVNADKVTTLADSDHESFERAPKEKQSKKKLDYPKNIQCLPNIQNATTIEIELEPIIPDAGNENNDSANNADASKKSNEDIVINDKSIKKNDKNVIKSDIVIEITESPAKTIQTPPSTPKKDSNQKRNIRPIEITTKNSEPLEFHPVYQEFIDLCLKLENSNDMNTIVEKKIKNYYRQVPKDYTESEEFVELVQGKLFSMRAGPEKLYLYIKDIVDELNLQRKMAKAKPILKETKNLEAEKFQYGEESEFDTKRQRQIRKLEKTLKKLHRAIQKLEEQEVDFDDEEDSVYLLTESDDSSSSIKDLDIQLERGRSVLLKRYKERMVRVHAKFCQLTNTKMPSEPRIQIQPRPGQPVGPAKRLEKWVNKKVPIGKPLPFPDFHDVLRCVREANDEDKLGWNEADIMEEARDLFTRCGKKLQRRRQENEWRLAASRISLETDPAEISEELKKKLDSNKQAAAKKETEVFNKYADKQSQLKLEAVEIGDKEAEESPVESEDDETQEENSNLENKEKRKERLRRLINEKSRKSEHKEKESKETLPCHGMDPSASEDINKDFEKHKNEENVVNLVTETIDENVMEVDFKPKCTNEDSPVSQIEDISMSGDNNVGSDVDELHLLQKLHSDEPNTSTIDSTDSDSPIDISDSLTSGDNKKPNSDVISIENSSYSETDVKDDVTVKDNVVGKKVKSEKESGRKEKKDHVIPDRLSGEIECSTEGVQLNKTNNQEYNESVESILLATSDEEVEERENDESPKSNDECMNLKDDAISIGETVVEQVNKIEAVAKRATVFTASSPVEDGVLKSNSKKSKEFEETSAKNVDSRIEGESSFLPFSETDSNDIAHNQDLMEKIYSVEFAESDGEQKTVKDSIEENCSTNDQQSEAKANSCVELIESDNGPDEAVKEIKPATIEHKRNFEATSNNSQESLESREPAKYSAVEQLDVIDNPSVETLESDNSQEGTKNDEESIRSYKLHLEEIKSPFVETIESDNSQEASKEHDALVLSTNQHHSNVVKTLESDNYQEIDKQYENIVMQDEHQSDVRETHPVETVESDKFREVVAKENEELTDCRENRVAIPPLLEATKDQLKTSFENESLEIHELTDSNSTEYIHDRVKSSEDMNQYALKEIEINEHCDNVKSLECMIINNHRSELAVSENLATTANLKE